MVEAFCSYHFSTRVVELSQNYLISPKRDFNAIFSCLKIFYGIEVNRDGKGLAKNKNPPINSGFGSMQLFCHHQNRKGFRLKFTEFDTVALFIVDSELKSHPRLRNNR